MQYKQTTRDQREIWLSDPVTIAYLDCLSYYREQVEKTLAKGDFIDPRNVDLTQYNAATLKARREILIEASNVHGLLDSLEKPEGAA